jgi:hypothetical protein
MGHSFTTPVPQISTAPHACSYVQESVKQAVAARPSHFVCATKKGTEATEEMLEAVADYYNVTMWGQC